LRQLRDHELEREATDLSANSDVALDVAAAANRVGNPSAFDPLAGIPGHPFFEQPLRFTQVMDSKGRIRLAAFKIDNLADTSQVS
jgi:hypothetical protein